jgi:hypothetical protein
VEFLLFSARDDDAYPILDECLASAAEAAHRARDQRGAVLVQCWGGCNRAPCLAVALLMQLDRLPLLSACEKVQAVRGHVLSNRAFRRQLLQLADAAHLLPDQDWDMSVASFAGEPLSWQTPCPDALLLLLAGACCRGSDLAQVDADGQTLNNLMANAAADCDWQEFNRLGRRWVLLRCLLDILRG